MLLALSSNQKLGIALVAGAFVVFALVSAMVIPRSHPDFPGRRLGLFLGVAGALTVAMLLTVAFVAKESGEEEQAAATETQPAPATEPPATETGPTTQATETTDTSTGETETTTTATATTETTTQPSSPAGDATAGKALFTSTCAGCHTLSDAGTSGTVGPNLDDRSPSYDKVVERVTHGKGVMPAFGDSGTLTDAQIQDVAAYVSSAAGS